MGILSARTAAAPGGGARGGWHASLAPSVALLLLAGMSACSFGRDPLALHFEGEQVGVYSMLRAGDDSVAVTVVTFPPDLQPFVRGWKPVRGADVRLTAGDDTLRLAEGLPGSGGCFTLPAGSVADSDSLMAGCYVAAMPGGVQVAAHYGLVVALPGGGQVTGETTIPASPALLTPAPGDTIAMQSGSAAAVALSWRARADVARLEAAFLPDYDGCETSLLDRSPTGNFVALDRVRGDSATVYVHSIRCRVDNVPVGWRSLSARVLLAAYDSAYARYAAALGLEGVAPAWAAAGLQGAVGFFAGTATTEVPVMFVAR